MSLPTTNFGSLDLSRRSSLYDKEKRSHSSYLDVSPDTDRGWAWVIVIASFFGHMLIYGITWTIGIFYLIFLEEFQQSPATTAWIGTINSACTYLGGPISSALVNRFGNRRTIIIGTIMSSAGLILSMFASSFYFLLASFSIITGTGLGIAYVPVVTIVGTYFDRYRNMAVGIAVAGIGFGTFIYPPLIRLLVALYDWRGTLLILGGLNLNLLIICALMRPPRPPQVSPEEVKRAKLAIGLYEDEDESRASLNTRHKLMRQLFHLYIFKNTHYIFLCANNLFALFGMSIVYMHLSSYAFTSGFSLDKSSLLLSVLGIANLVGRIVFGLFGQHPRVNVVGMYCVTLIIIGFLTILCPLIKYYPGLVGYSALFGFLASPIGTLLPEVLITIVGLDRLTTAFGYLLFFEAVGFLIGGPVAGWFLEYFGSYLASFILAGASLALSGFLMILPWNSSTKPWDLSQLDTGPRYAEEAIEAIINGGPA